MFLDHPIIAQRYFFPRRDPLPETTWVEAPAGRLACFAARPHPGARTLVHFHGNGETVSDYLPEIADAIVASGVNVFFAEYRGYGASDGAPQLAAMLDDVEAIVEATGSPPEELIIFGRSVGSIYAIEAVRRFPQVWGLVLESGIADVLERVLLRVDPAELGASVAELTDEARQVLDHQTKLAGYTGRLLVLHAAQDHLIHISHAERNFAWAASPPANKRLVVFDHGDHNSILALNLEAYFDELAAFLRGWQPS